MIFKSVFVTSYVSILPQMENIEKKMIQMHFMIIRYFQGIGT